MSSSIFGEPSAARKFAGYDSVSQGRSQNFSDNRGNCGAPKKRAFRGVWGHAPP